MLLLLVLALATLTTPELARPKAAFGPSVKDERGFTVAIPPGPHRVALYMGIGAGEYLVDGAQPRGLAVQDNSDNRFALQSGYLKRALPGLDRVSMSLKDAEGPTVNVEALLASPHRVLLITWARLADRFERVGLPVVGMLGLSTPQRHIDNARVFTTVAGRPQRAASLQNRYLAAQVGVARAVASLDERSLPRVATVEFSSAGPLRLFALQPDEAAVAGGRDAIPVPGGAAFIDTERLLAADPDVLIIPWPSARLSITPARLRESPVLKVLRAVRCGRAFAAPPGVTGYAFDLVQEPIRYRWLAEALHPALSRRSPSFAAQTYTEAFGVPPTGAELSTLLSLRLNTLAPAACGSRV